MPPIIVDGYHGTTREAAQLLLSQEFAPSANPWEWLGHGVYFWQDAPRRAREWAREWLARKNYHGPVAVVGARIQLNNFVDLLDLEGSDFLRRVATSFVSRPSDRIPKNKPPRNNLDCAVFNFATTMLSSEGIAVAGYRAACVEGEPLVEDSPIFTRSHVQLAVLDQSCILRKWIVEDDEGV